MMSINQKSIVHWSHISQILNLALMLYNT